MLGLYTFPGSMVSGGAGDAFFVPFYNLAVLNSLLMISKSLYIITSCHTPI